MQVPGNAIHYGYETVPDDLKVKTIDTIADPAASYSFDDFWVFQHINSGRIFYGSDSGCSCPTPFENENWGGPDDTTFTEVTRTNFDDFVRELWAHCNEHKELQDQKREVERKVRTILWEN
jgi:hypothetical protein